MENREIKFRAWDGESMTGEFAVFADGRGAGAYHHSTSSADEVYKDYIVMQYTGFKDINGKEIYEGDIVNYMELNLIVSFAAAHFFIHRGATMEDKYTKDHEDLWKALNRSDVTVIGNIYENPELLKGGDDNGNDN